MGDSLLRCKPWEKGLTPGKAGGCHDRRLHTNSLAGKPQRIEVGQETLGPLASNPRFSFASVTLASSSFFTSTLISKRGTHHLGEDESSEYLSCLGQTSPSLQQGAWDGEKLETNQLNYISDLLTSKQCGSTCSQHWTL